MFFLKNISLIINDIMKISKKKSISSFFLIKKLYFCIPKVVRRRLVEVLDFLGKLVL